MNPPRTRAASGFAEDLDHPVFRGLTQKDFFTWGPDEILFRNAYVKPVRGAKSLLQCGNLLQNSGLVEVQAGQGVMLLSQLVIGEKLSHNPVAQTLLENLINYAETYKQVFRPVSAAVSEGSQLAKVLDAMGLQYGKVTDPLAALQTPGGVAVIEATPENLKALAEHLPAVERFTQGGGFLLLSGLTPEGLASYNKLVGFEHVIRPFKRERVVFPAVRDPLTAGLTTGDVASYSSQRIFPWTEGNYVVSDEFSYVIDYDEVAPFGKSSFYAYDNIVNGFVNADGWPLIINFRDQQGRFALRDPDHAAQAANDHRVHLDRQHELLSADQGESGFRRRPGEQDLATTWRPRAIPRSCPSIRRERPGRSRWRSPGGKRSRARGRWWASTTSTSRPNGRRSSTAA